MKKANFTILCCVLISCFCGSFRQAKALYTSSKKGKDTLCFFQVCIDTVHLPIYRPTEEGLHFLNKVLDSKHQNRIKFPQGVFEISEQMQADTIWTVSYINKNINFFAQYGWNSFKGIVYYKDHTFLIKHPISDESVRKLFEDTQQKEDHPEYADRLYVKADEKILWRLIKRGGQYEFVFLYPPSTIIDVNLDDFE